MTVRHSEVVAEVVDRLLDEAEARARGPLNPRRQVLDHSSDLVQRIWNSRSCCASLADLMVACYHLGKEQTLERVAIGLATLPPLPPEPANEQGLAKDGRLVRPDRAETVSPEEDRDPYPNVPIDDETICLGDEPLPPQETPARVPSWHGGRNQAGGDRP